jgi:hypothetical protein
VELDKFMCGIDGRVAKERSKREARYALGFRGGCSSAGRVVVAATIAASVAAAAVASSKVFWWSLLRSQIGWVVEVGVDLFLACSAGLLSLRGCASWYFLISSGAWTLSTGSHVLLLSGYPFHLIRYWSLRQ